jgi:hypothetical protein
MGSSSSEKAERAGEASRSGAADPATFIGRNTPSEPHIGYGVLGWVSLRGSRQLKPGSMLSDGLWRARRPPWGPVGLWAYPCPQTSIPH